MRLGGNRIFSYFNGGEQMSLGSRMPLAILGGAALLLAAAVSPAVKSARATTGPRLKWFRLTTPATPTPRAIGAMAYDPVSRKVVLFGGYSGTGYLEDTWTFDGVTWARVTTSATPPARVAAAMAFDQGSQKLVLFGGYNGTNYLNDTWLWDGAMESWQQTSPSVRPTAVTGPSLFMDPANGHVDNFGGFDGMFYQLTTYQWTGTDWQVLHPKTSPFARGAAIAALDNARNNVVLYGGLADLNPLNTWTWDGTNWTEVFPATQPNFVYDSAAVFEPHLNAVVAFGGASGGVDLNRTWEWTGSNWVQLAPQNLPPAREGHGMVYDPVVGHIVVFGGEAGNTIYRDTWELLVSR
jgi:Galactose oxidase, central domain